MTNEPYPPNRRFAEGFWKTTLLLGNSFVHFPCPKRIDRSIFRCSKRWQPFVSASFGQVSFWIAGKTRNHGFGGQPGLTKYPPHSGERLFALVFPSRLPLSGGAKGSQQEDRRPFWGGPLFYVLLSEGMTPYKPSLLVSFVVSFEGIPK